MPEPTLSNPLPAAPLHGQNRGLWILLAVVAAIHTPALFQPFFIDDYVYLDTVHDLDWPGLVDIFTSATMGRSASGVWWVPLGTLPFCRPVGQLSFWLDHCIWGLRPFGYHLTNLLLHLVCTVLTWRLAKRLFEARGEALAAAVVFALHPVHGEAVSWISGRFDLLVCVCMIASVLSYLNWLRGSSPGWLWGAVSVFWFVIGLGCKETALILPAVLVGVELLLPGPGQANRTRRLAAAATFGVVSLLYLAGRYALFGGLLGSLPPPYGLDTSTPLIALMGILSNLSQYLLDFVLFIQVEPVFFAQFWHDNPVLLGMALTFAASILLMGTLLAWRSRVFRVALIWTVLFTAPSLLAMPGERNIYLANVGVALMVAAALQGLGRRRRKSHPAEPHLLAGRWRWVFSAVLALWLVVSVIEQGLMWCVSATGEKVLCDLEAMLPDPPRDARIYVVGQSPLNSVGFTQAIRLRYGREDLSGCALSLSPTVAVSTTDRFTFTGPNTIRLDRQGGDFFASFIERFHLFEMPVAELPQASLRAGFELLNPPSTYDGLTELEFRFPYPFDDPRLQLFFWDNTQVRGWVDLLRAASITELRPCESSAPAS